MPSRSRTLLGTAIQVFRVSLWLLAIAYVARWTYFAADRVLVTREAAAAIALCFTFFALLAKPFYLYGQPTFEWQFDFRWKRSPREGRRPDGLARFWRFERVPIRPRSWAGDWNWLRTLALCCAAIVVAGTFTANVLRERLLTYASMRYGDMRGLSVPMSTVVYAADGKEEICNFSEEDRMPVRLADVPKHVRECFKAAEDKNFDRHRGVDLVAKVRALRANFRSGSKGQGGSTITEQVIKMKVIKSKKKTWMRKALEFVLAPQLEKLYTKDQILELYLNEVFYGENAYGIRVAARTYFGKEVKDLTDSEAAFLAALPKAPSAHSPARKFEKAKDRRRYVIGRARQNGALSEAQAKAALDEDVTLIRQGVAARPAESLTSGSAPYFCDHQRRKLKKMFGNDEVFRKGFAVTSTIDMPMQRAAESVARAYLEELERRLGFSGPDLEMCRIPQQCAEGRCTCTVPQSGEQCTVLAKSTYCYVFMKRPPPATCESEGEGPIDDQDREQGIVVASAASAPPAKAKSKQKQKAAPTRSVSLCVRGKRFPLHPDDVARVATWERNGKNRRLVPGHVLSVRIRSQSTQAGKGKAPTTVRYAVSAKRTAVPLWTPRGVKWPLNVAMVGFSPQTGDLKFMVGGYDFAEKQYNMATMAHRQVGSSVKPYIFAAALESGKTTVDRKMVDAPRCFQMASGMWCPKNFFNAHSGPAFLGMVDMGKALAKSLNSISIALAAEIGVGNVIKVMRRMGVTSPIVPVLPMAIGTPELTPMEHGYALGSIAAGGRRLPRHDDDEPGVFMTRIVDSRGDVRYAQERSPRKLWLQAIRGDIATEAQWLMREVCRNGTGRRTQELGWPTICKTGTSNNEKDVWFFGCTPELCLIIWVGREKPEHIGYDATGGSVAVPLWVETMKLVHPRIAPYEFPIDEDAALMYLDDKRVAPFARGKIPERYLHRQRADLPIPPTARPIPVAPPVLQHRN